MLPCSNLCFCSLHIVEASSMFLAVSFIMRILVSVGEASILPSAIAIGLEDSRVQEDDLTAMYLLPST